MRLLVKSLILSAVTIVLSAHGAQAADFKTIPSGGSFSLKKEFSVDIKINSDGTSINAGQAKLTFPSDILEVKSISKEGSIFNFWLQEPVFSNTDGTIEFIGGTPNGISGATLQVVRIVFTTKGVGSANLLFKDAAITAADGTGTNILNTSTDSKYVVSTGSVANAVVPDIVQEPTQIKRTAIKANNKPVAPVISVQLYPKVDAWYNNLSSFTVNWTLPPDVSDVATAFNKNPRFEVPPVSQGLYESKMFAAANESGVYYVHVRFKNNIGWGETAHYRIGLDTDPPLPFSIEVQSGSRSDNPSPQLTARVGDALSGIDHYAISIDSEPPLIVSADQLMASNSSNSDASDIFEFAYSLPPHSPKKYLVTVKIFDRAGNSIESKAELEILPIASPEVTSYTKTILQNTDDTLQAKGLGIQGSEILITIEDNKKFLIYEGAVSVNQAGEWEFKLDRELRNGAYFMTAMSKDSRGAISDKTTSIRIDVKDKPIIQLFGIEITLKTLLIILVIVIVLILLYFYRKTIKHLSRSQREAIIINRDIKNAFGQIGIVVDNFSRRLKDAEGNKISIDPMYAKYLGDIQTKIKKIETYVGKDIEKLN